MLKDIGGYIRREMQHSRTRTTRSFTVSDGTELIVTLANWRWGVIESRLQGTTITMQKYIEGRWSNAKISAETVDVGHASRIIQAELEDDVDDCQVYRERRFANSNYHFPAAYCIKFGRPKTRPWYPKGVEPPPPVIRQPEPEPEPDRTYRTQLKVPLSFGKPPAS